MRLWIDDVREPPDDSWLWAESSAHALAYFEYHRHSGDPCVEISFDHDLGGDDTAMPVAKRIEQLAYHAAIPPLMWRVHSANPVGRKNIEAAMLSAERFWKQPRST